MLNNIAWEEQALGDVTHISKQNLLRAGDHNPGEVLAQPPDLNLFLSPFPTHGRSYRSVLMLEALLDDSTGVQGEKLKGRI